jgi:hypothetical protein
MERRRMPQQVGCMVHCGQRRSCWRHLHSLIDWWVKTPGALTVRALSKVVGLRVKREREVLVGDAAMGQGARGVEIWWLEEA